MGKSWSREHRGPPAIVRMVRITKAQRPIWAKVGREGIADQGDRTNIMAQSQYGQKVCHASWHKANMGKWYVTREIADHQLWHEGHFGQEVGRVRHHGPPVMAHRPFWARGRSHERSWTASYDSKAIWAKGRSRETSRTTICGSKAKTGKGWSHSGPPYHMAQKAKRSEPRVILGKGRNHWSS